MGREKKDTNPVILKIGLALAFSLGGMLCSFIRNNRIRPAKSPSEDSMSPDFNNQGIPRMSSLETPNSCQFDPLAKDEHNSLTDKDFYLLPEFNDLLKEFDLTAIKRNPDLPISDANSQPKVNSMVKADSHEQEIKNLRNIVKTLKEKERKLEYQLLKYYGLKEQQTAVIELQNRLKLNDMESKLFSLKIDSLETDNKRLESQMADYNKVLMDLEAARAKIEVLQKKLRSEAAQNKERILDLQQRVEKMQEDEHNRSAKMDPDIDLKLCKFKDLEGEVINLRKSNYNLLIEKSELTQRLEHLQILATSVLEEKEMEKLKKESVHLKDQNEILIKEIEQLQADRCSDVEELVYMRWLNACLRYELRNHQPGPGKTMARDLSKTLSPNSEQKAKRLILEYATQEGDGKTIINIPELGSDQWSSPPSSNPLDSVELSEPFLDHTSSRKSNYKFFGKLVKVLRGKDGNTPDHHHYHQHHNHHVHDYNRHHNQRSPSRNSSLERAESVGEYMDSYSDLGIHRRVDSIDDGFLGSSSSSECQKSELMKYAEVLQDSNRKPPTRYRWRSTQFSSF